MNMSYGDLNKGCMRASGQTLYESGMEKRDKRFGCMKTKYKLGLLFLAIVLGGICVRFSVFRGEHSGIMGSEEHVQYRHHI